MTQMTSLEVTFLDETKETFYFTYLKVKFKIGGMYSHASSSLRLYIHRMVL